MTSGRRNFGLMAGPVVAPPLNAKRRDHRSRHCHRGFPMGEIAVLRTACLFPERAVVRRGTDRVAGVQSVTAGTPPRHWPAMEPNRAQNFGSDGASPGCGAEWNSRRR